MPSPIGLKEAIQIVKECDPSEFDKLLHDQRLMGFYNNLNQCGTDALKSMSTHDALSAFEFIQIATVLQLVSYYEECGDSSSMMEAMALAGSSVFQNAINLAVKSGIGLAITEELY